MAHYQTSIVTPLVFFFLLFPYIGLYVHPTRNILEQAAIVGQDVLIPPFPPSSAPCQLRCGGRCCPQNSLFPYICVAPGICTEIFRTHNCEGITCSPSVPCDTANPGCCPVGRICGETCCPPDSTLNSYFCQSRQTGLCAEVPIAHYCEAALCPLHIPCDTTGEGCCPNAKVCGHGDICCPPDDDTFNYECDPTSLACKAIKRCNNSDNPCNGTTCVDDGYCCPDSMACDSVCCIPPLVPEGWKCASKVLNLCCDSDAVVDDENRCCPVEWVITVPPSRLVCCRPPWKPYGEMCCDEQDENCFVPDAAASRSAVPNTFK